MIFPSGELLAVGFGRTFLTSKLKGAILPSDSKMRGSTDRAPLVVRSEGKFENIQQK
jgi:hypothetical protein